MKKIPFLLHLCDASRKVTPCHVTWLPAHASCRVMSVHQNTLCLMTNSVCAIVGCCVRICAVAFPKVKSPPAAAAAVERTLV